MIARADHNAAPEPIALRPREAARLLSIGERTLWNLTAPRGPIPVAKVGAARLYRRLDLEAWLAEQIEAQR